MEIDPLLLKQATPGALGAMSAVGLMQGSFIFRILMIVPGGTLAYYGSDYAAAKTGAPAGLAGFLLGLLGMLFIAKVVATWERLDLGGLLGSVLSRWFGARKGDEK